MTRWLNAREWLEHERLTGLPHADFAAEALREMGELDHNDEMIRAIDQDLGEPDDLPGRCKKLLDFEDAVLTALVDAGVIEDDCPADQVGGLLRMFLPC